MGTYTTSVTALSILICLVSIQPSIPALKAQIFLSHNQGIQSMWPGAWAWVSTPSLLRPELGTYPL